MRTPQTYEQITVEGRPGIVFQQIHGNSLLKLMGERPWTIASYIREYLRVSGLAMADIDPWILPVAAGRLVEWLPVSEKELLVREIRKRLRALPPGK